MPHLTLLDRSGRTYRVDATDAVVGRDPSVALPLQGEGTSVVSSRHARLYLADGFWWIEDIGSRNGTYLDGQRIPVGVRHRVRPATEISFGATGPKLRVEEAETRTFDATPAEPVAAIALAPAPAPDPVDPNGPAVQHVRLALRSADGRRLLGEDLEVIIGRSQECTIRIEGDMSMAVSRRHARIFYSGWKICIEDAGSRNGTWLNRKRVQSATVLERGDIIEFGAGGPRLTVEDVILVAAQPVRRTALDIPIPSASGAFVSELPTPAPRPTLKASGDA